MSKSCINDPSESSDSLEREEEDSEGTNMMEEKYFRDPFSEEEMKQIAESIGSAIGEPLSKLEKDGYSAFSEWCAQAKKREEEIANLEEQRNELALDDVVIRGNPRDYQNAIFEIAKKKNIIVNLGTGFGKTLIALLCIRHFDSSFEQGKQTLFLVPSVALAVQQSMVLKANLPYSVNVSCHASTSTEKSRQELSKSNIIVATHGAIYDLLCHHSDMFHMTRFNLLVIDECHYAAGNHAYLAIMLKFYHKTPRDRRPHVLGLTASPLLNVKASHSSDQLENMLSKLETALDAVLLPVGELGVDRKLQKKIAEEQDVPYVGTVSTVRLPEADDVNLHASRRKELRQLAQLYDDLGPFALSIYCKTLRNEISRNTYEQETGEQFNNLLRHLEEISAFCTMQCKNCPCGGRTDKLLALEEKLEQQIETLGSADTVGLVFVERRITALALCDYFRTRLEALKTKAWIDVKSSRNVLFSTFADKIHQGQSPAFKGSSAPPYISDRKRIRHNSAVPNRGHFEHAKDYPAAPDGFDLDHAENVPANPFVDDSWRFADADETGDVYGLHDDQFGDAEESTGAISGPLYVANQGEFHYAQTHVCNSFVEPDELYELGHEPRSGVMPPEHSQFMDADESLSDNVLCMGGIEYRGETRNHLLGASANEGYSNTEDIAKKTNEQEQQLHSATPVGDYQFMDADETDLGVVQADGEQDETVQVLESAEKDSINETTKISRLSNGEADNGGGVDETGGNNDYNETIRCGVLVRKSTHIFKTLSDKRSAEAEKLASQEWLHQETKIREVLSSLRQGEINVLIATSVVEEGVDVRACSFVVVFDGLKSTKGYIQMKGRARQQNAKFFVFHNCQDSSQPLSLASAQEIEQTVHQFIESRKINAPTPYLTEYPTYFHGDSECLELRAIEEGRYDTLNGFVDLFSSKSLINRYGLSLPIDPVVRQTKVALLAHLPIYATNQLILPAHLPREVRLVNLPNHLREQPKKLKQQMMAIMACVRLHKLRLLSERLLPLTRADLKAQISYALRKIPPRPVECVTPFVSNSVDTENRKFYVYPVEQKSSVLDRMTKVFQSKGHSLAIISENQIENIPEVHYLHTEFGQVSCGLGNESNTYCSESELDVLSQFFVVLMNSRWRRRKRNAFFQPCSAKKTTSTLPVYYVGCISEQGHLDIAFMQLLIGESERSKEERINAVQTSSSKESLPEPRLWAPLYDEFATYIAYGPSGVCNETFPGEKEGVATYKDYFKVCKDFEVSADSHLFDVQRLWTLPQKGCKVTDGAEIVRKKVQSKCHSTSFHLCQELVSLKLPQDACVEVPLANASIALLSTFLPQFLHYMETCLTARSFICHCDLNFPHLRECLRMIPLLEVAQALTAKSCNQDECYERLEWLGDAVLKLVQTDSLLESTDLSHWIKFLHEGDLSFLRSDMGCNAHLETLCKHLKIDQFILITPLARGTWVPSALELYSPTQGTTSSEDVATSKICADVIEALLGLVYIYSGYEASSKVADDLQLSLPKGEVDIVEEEQCVATKPHLLAVVKAFTGHNSFNHTQVVEQAFTHPTAFHPEVSSYQKLEWIGDAVLCLAVREWIYNEYPDAEVGDMVEKEAALVANETLSFLCIRNDLQRHINHRDQTLPSRIDDYVESIQGEGKGLWGTDPPKVLADVVEALIGAVYVDSGFEAGIRAVRHILATMLDAFRSLGVRGNDYKFAHPKSTMKHLGGRLLTLVSSKEEDFARSHPRAQVWFGNRWGVAEKNGTRVVASVECLGTIIASVADKSAYSAKNRACAFVVYYIKHNPSLLSRLMQCRQIIDRKQRNEKEEISNNEC